MLNPDGTPIGCGTTDAQGAPSDLAPATWPTQFATEFADAAGAEYTTRLGWSCDDCWAAADGINGAAGFPIGFPIDFFGTTYSNVFVNSNGSIAFDGGSSTYDEPLEAILDGNPGVVAYGLDLDNREIANETSAWGSGRHGDFFYWGRTTYGGHSAFVATWMNIQPYSASVSQTDWNTFQIMLVDIDDAAGDDVDIIVNYGSLHDSDEGYDCVAGQCRAAVGVGTVVGGSVQYASMVDDDGVLYNGMLVADIADTGSNPLSQGHLNSAVPGRFQFEMRNGTLPEAATVPGPVSNLAATTGSGTADLTWNPPTELGNSPLNGYLVRWRLAGSADPFTEDTPTTNLLNLAGLVPDATYEYEVAAVNGVGVGPFSPLAYFVAASALAPAWIDSTIGTMNAGTAFSDVVIAAGAPTPTYAITAGALPAGLTLDASTGAITGTPTAGGPYTFTVTASNGVAPDATQAFSGAVTQAPTFVDTTIGLLVAGQSTSDGVTANGFPAPTYAVTAGALPAGLTLNPTTGAITGTPTASGPYSVEITATNTSGSVTQTLTGSVATLPVFTDQVLIDPTVGGPYSDAVAASGSPAPTYAVTAGALPAGLTLDPATGAITGIATTAGPYAFTITATNLAGTVSVAFSGTVAEAPARGYLALNPGRLFDSRTSGTPVDSGTVTEIDVLGRFGVPGDADAVVLNVTVTEALGDGYATVYPCGAERPLASNLNFTTGETATNAVTVSVGANGKVCVYTTAATHLVADVNGAYSPTEGNGHLEPLTPARVFDSRDLGTPLEGGAITEIDIVGRGGVPLDARAVIVNMTVTEPTAVGYATVFPCGQPQPLASNLNFVAGETVPNAVTAAIGDAGRICVFSTVTTHLVVDVNGAYTPDGIGHLQGVVPQRLIDTRSGAKPAAGSVQVLNITGRAGVPADTVAVALNVTITEPDAAGYATVFPCTAEQPWASNLNFVGGQTVPNSVTASLDANGDVCIYTTATAHLVVDLNSIYAS